MFHAKLLYTIEEEKLESKSVRSVQHKQVLESVSADHGAIRRSPAAVFASEFPEGSVE